jgi:hypothetical protein
MIENVLDGRELSSCPAFHRLVAHAYAWSMHSDAVASALLTIFGWYE